MSKQMLFLLSQLKGQKDYMGLAIKNDNLVYVYNLKGEDVEIPLSSKPVSQWPAVFNYIKIERWSNFGNVLDVMKTVLIAWVIIFSILHSFVIHIVFILKKLQTS